MKPRKLPVIPPAAKPLNDLICIEHPDAELIASASTLKAELDWERKIKASLLTALGLLIDTFESHEVETLDCDHRGDVYCNCLENNIKWAKQVIARAKGEPEVKHD
jgi:hypothetical protein